MDIKPKNRGRKLVQISFRPFEDQIDSLRYLAQVKHRGLMNVSDLMRTFLDQGIASEMSGENGK